MFEAARATRSRRQAGRWCWADANALRASACKVRSVGGRASRVARHEVGTFLGGACSFACRSRWGVGWGVLVMGEVGHDGRGWRRHRVHADLFQEMLCLMYLVSVVSRRK